MLRSGSANFEGAPITTVLSGPIGTKPTGWPSGRHGAAVTPPAHIDLREEVKPSEQHGSTIADFDADGIELRLFTWNRNRESVEAIDGLQPFHTTRVARPA